MKKLISILIALGLLVNIAPIASAKPKGDWAAIMVTAESTETQSSQSRVKRYSKTLLGQGAESSNWSIASDRCGRPYNRQTNTRN